MFIYCFDDKTKQEFIKKGLQFLKETQTNNKKAYMFILNNKQNFDLKGEYIISDKLTF